MNKKIFRIAITCFFFILMITSFAIADKPEWAGKPEWAEKKQIEREAEKLNKEKMGNIFITYANKNIYESCPPALFAPLINYLAFVP